MRKGLSEDGLERFADQVGPIERRDADRHDNVGFRLYLQRNDPRQKTSPQSTSRTGTSANSPLSRRIVSRALLGVVAPALRVEGDTRNRGGVDVAPHWRGVS